MVSDGQITFFDTIQRDQANAYRTAEVSIKNILNDRTGFDSNTEFTYNKGNLAVSFFKSGNNSRSFWITLGNKSHKLEVKYSYFFLIDSLIEKRDSVEKLSNGRVVFRFADFNELQAYKSIILDIYDYCEREAKGSLFDCCHRYEECSNALDCIHPDKEFSLCCSYRKKLKQGIVFFGINRNADQISTPVEW